MEKKTRFEVFKRDNFTCQYCGRKPPIAILEVDHIVSISEGGKEDMSNYITSCFDCNRGKGKVLLSTIKDKVDYAEEKKKLVEKKLQLEEYKKFLKDEKEKVEKDIEDIDSFWSLRTGFKCVLADSSKESIRKFLKYLPSEKIKEAIEIAFAKFPKRSKENRNMAFRYMCGILHNWKRELTGETSFSEAKQVISYWNKKRPQDWKEAPEGIVEQLLKTYDTSTIKYCVDVAVQESRGWTTFDDIVRKLKEMPPDR